MKTNINTTKESARNFRNEYLNMMAEVERRRAQYQRMVAAIHTAENEVIAEMYRTITVLMNANGGEFPNANQITAAMGGKMTRHEVVGQLTVALGEHYNGHGKTHKATHEPTQAHIDRRTVCADYKYRIRKFAEVDASGSLIPNGEVKEVKECVKVYGVKGA